MSIEVLRTHCGMIGDPNPKVDPLPFESAFAAALLDFRGGNPYAGSMTMTAEVGTGQLAELVKQVQVGNEVLLTQGNKLVAKIVPALRKETAKDTALHIRSLKGHRIRTPVISQADLAEEMFRLE